MINIATFTITTSHDFIDQVHEKKIKRLIKKHEGLVVDSPFLLAGIFHNYDQLTVLKVYLDQESIDYTITLAQKHIEYKSSHFFKVENNNGNISLRNPNYSKKAEK